MLPVKLLIQDQWGQDQDQGMDPGQDMDQDQDQDLDMDQDQGIKRLRTHAALSAANAGSAVPCLSKFHPLFVLQC